MKTQKAEPIVGLLWWKVAMSADGGIKSCEQVEITEPVPGRLVTFVQATRKTDAVLGAQNWYRRYTERKRAAAKARKVAAEKAGKCNICRVQPAADGCKRCKHCKAAAKDKSAPNGLAVACQQAEVRASKSASAGLSFRAALLAGVLSAYDSNPSTFRAWLVAEIASAS